MPIEQHKLSPKIVIALEASRRISSAAFVIGFDRLFLLNIQEPVAPCIIRVQTLFLFATIVFEHHDSIVHLIETGNFGSSFTLLRSVVETFYRGMWMMLCGSDDDIAEIRAGTFEFTMGFKEMTRAVDGKLGGSGVFIRPADEWKSMCGFAHSGAEQLTRRFRPDGQLMPNYPEEEILGLLLIATTVMAVMVTSICRIEGRDSDGEQIGAIYTELLPNLGHTPTFLN